MEQERVMVLHLNFVLDVFNRGGEIAGTTQLATAEASPDLAGRVLREGPGQDLGPDKRLKVAALCLEHAAPPSLSGGLVWARRGPESLKGAWNWKPGPGKNAIYMTSKRGVGGCLLASFLARGR
jgi:hypothetical protein